MRKHYLTISVFGSIMLVLALLLMNKYFHNYQMLTMTELSDIHGGQCTCCCTEAECEAIWGEDEGGVPVLDHYETRQCFANTMCTDGPVLSCVIRSFFSSSCREQSALDVYWAFGSYWA